MNKRVAVAFTGPSNSGKTTLVEKIAQILIKERKVAIIKNDPKDKAQFDVEGKDSYKFSQTGAEVVITSPTRTTYFSQREKTLDDIVAMISDFDILLVEGLKTLPLPRIAIFRNKIDESYFECSEAIAIDETIDQTQYTIPKGIDILDLNNTAQIIEWINTHAKNI
ncbi:MAG: molybdopterin-guanine dinucleotide biosynthesis protein B [Sulfurovum sp.]|nr:MAG: molybdopterin-guanine dinucleotide biosynthesis protein B [Sulfurovum sp.]